MHMALTKPVLPWVYWWMGCVSPFAIFSRFSDSREISENKDAMYSSPHSSLSPTNPLLVSILLHCYTPLDWGLVTQPKPFSLLSYASLVSPSDNYLISFFPTSSSWISFSFLFVFLKFPTYYHPTAHCYVFRPNKICFLCQRNENDDISVVYINSTDDYLWCSTMPEIKHTIRKGWTSPKYNLKLKKGCIPFHFLVSPEALSNYV